MRRSFSVATVIFAVLIVVLMAGCESREKAKEEESKALALRAFEEIWNQGKLEVIDEIYAADFVHHSPGSPDLDPEGLKQFVTMYRSAFPDIQFTIEDQIAEGDKVVTRWSTAATHKGELMGIQPTGLAAPGTGISIGRYADGKCVESWTNWDALGMWRKLGIVPPIGQEAPPIAEEVPPVGEEKE